MELKYIMLQLGDSFLPVVFPKTLIHKDVAKGMEYASHRMGEVVSAGFAWYDDKTNAWQAYGRSESLDLDSNPEDGKRITQLYK
jgi:hypothetical protein